MEAFVVTQMDGQRGLALTGELDLQSVDSLKEALARLPAGGQATLDLSEMTFIDSTGLHAIMDFAGGENGSGPVVLEGVSAHVAKVFEITQLTDSGLVEIRRNGHGS
jgi:anti-anti-sigma factor